MTLNVYSEVWAKNPHLIIKEKPIILCRVSLMKLIITWNQVTSLPNETNRIYLLIYELLLCLNHNLKHSKWSHYLQTRKVPVCELNVVVESDALQKKLTTSPPSTHQHPTRSLRNEP